LNFEAVADNPKINGIILYRGDLKDTDYYKLEGIRENFDNHLKALGQSDVVRDQIMEEYMKKRRMKKTLRNDFEDDTIHETEEVIELGSGEPKKGFGLKKLILTILGGLVGFCMLNRRKAPGN
jgi:hypothetical protein